MDNSFTNLLEGGKSVSGQQLYTCSLCYKEFLYYHDFAIHERMHLEQLSLTSGLQGGVRYDNRPPLYNSTPTVGGTTLESFEKLIQPFRGDVPPPPHIQDHRGLPPASTAPEPDKGNTVYRTEADNRGVMSLDTRAAPVESRGVTMDTRNVAMDTRPLSVDSRTMPVDIGGMQLPGSIDSRTLGSVDPRSLQLDHRTLAYSTSSYMDSLGRGLYTADLAKSQIPTPTTYTPQLPVRHDDFLTFENRNVLPKMDSQIYSKPDPYYGLTKSHFTHLGGQDKPADNFPPQYNLSKLLSPPLTQPSYYATPIAMPPGPSPTQSMDKISAPSPVYYNQPSPSLIPKPDKKLPSPKQTFYGQTPMSQTSTNTTNSSFHLNMPQRPAQLPSPVTREINPAHRDIYSPIPRDLLSKPPEKTAEFNINRTYQGGHTSPNLTFPDHYKGQSQGQVFSPVPTQAQPSTQIDYSQYKLSSEPIPTVNIDFKPPSSNHPAPPIRPVPQEVTCYICNTPFANMNELSEHMKIHARAEMGMDKSSPVNFQKQPAQPTVGNTTSTPDYNINQLIDLPSTTPAPIPVSIEQPTNQQPATIPSTNQHPATIPSTSTLSSTHVEDHKCKICHKTFTKQADLIEHTYQLHTLEQFECKICKKVFSKKSKCLRHEALHQRDIQLFYCEICEEAFKYKGNYVHHVHQKHSIVDSGSEIAKPASTSSETKKSYRDENYVDCQVCDEEISKEELVDHLKKHNVHACDKCDSQFVLKTEYVEHLMTSHWRELADSNDTIADMDNIQTTKASKVIENVVASSKVVNKQEVSDKTAKEIKAMLKKKEKKEKKKLGEVDIVKEKDHINTLKEQTKEVKKILKEKQKEMKKIEKEQKKKEKKEAKMAIEQKEKPVKELKMKNLKDNLKIEQNKPEVIESGVPIKDTIKLKFSCSKCDDSFAKKEDLTLHVEIHQRDPTRIYCEVCEMNYHARDKGYYVYHMKYHTDKEISDDPNESSEFPCAVCYKQIPRKEYVSHILNEHSQYPCEICRWCYSSESSLNTHIKRIHGKKYKILVEQQKQEQEQLDQQLNQKPAPVVYRKVKDLKPEEGSASKKAQKLFTCEVCSKTFVKKMQFEKHLKVHNLTLEEPHVVCEICEVKFVSRGSYLFHIQKDHKYFKPIESQGIEEHIATLLSSEHLWEDDAEIDLKNEKKNDEKEKKVADSDSKTVIKKDEGDQVTDVKVTTKIETDDLKLKIESTNEIVKSESLDDKVKEVKIEQEIKVECKEEIKTEQKEVKLSLAMVLNTVTGEFEEKEVEETEELEIDVFKNFVEPSEVIEIKDVKENSESIDKSESVDKSENIDKLESVDKSGSIDTKRVIDVVSNIMYCKLCNKCLKKGTAFEHMKTHTIYNCFVCEYAFTKRKAFLHHRKILHFEDIINEEIDKVEELEKFRKSEETDKVEAKGNETNKRKRIETFKTVACPLCSNEFKQDKYIDHIRSHAKPKFVCCYCDREFSKKLHLTVHEKAHQRISMPRNELPYPRSCPKCDSCLESRERYVLHMCEHSRKKPFKCKKCSATFVTDKSLDNHCSVYHNDNLRVMWKLDGEGLRYDVKVCRVGEVISDYLYEIREINELMKANNKAEIWLNTTSPKKVKEKVVNMNKSSTKAQADDNNESTGSNEEASETDSEEQKKKTETSDEEYVPDETEQRRLPRRKSLRKKVEKKDEKVKKTADDVDESGESEKGESSENDEASESEENSDVEYRPSSKRKRRSRYAAGSDDDYSEVEEYTPKGTRTRQAPVKAKPKQKKKSGRELPSRLTRSRLENKDNSNKGVKRKETDRTPTRSRSQLESAKKVKTSPAKKLLTAAEAEKYKLEPGEHYPVKCPICDFAASTMHGYLEHFAIHCEEKPFKCLKCTQSFVRQSKLNNHILTAHMKSVKKVKTKSKTENVEDIEVKSPITGKLRTRSKNLKSEIGTPKSSSTPIKGSGRLVVKLSPIDIEKVMNKSGNTSIKLNNSDSQDKSDDSGDLHKCEFCKKIMQNKWNYKQHIAHHIKEIKNQEGEKSNKAALKRENVKKTKKDNSKKEMKREEEFKPFSCKDCSESFKKKRDLYIHAKVHSNEPMDEDEDTSTRTEPEGTDSVEMSKSNITDSSADCTSSFNIPDHNTSITTGKKQITSKVTVNESIKTDESASNENDSHNTSLNDSIGVASNMDLGDSFSIDQETYQIVVSDRKSVDESENENPSDRSIVSAGDEKVNQDTENSNESNKKVDNKLTATVSAEEPAAKVKNNGFAKKINNRNGSTSSSDSLESRGKEVVSSDSKSVLANNNEEGKKSEDGDSDEKSKPGKSNTPLNKMSLETAISKWKNKVKATLSSQLELHSNRKEQEMTNPEAKKVKEFLSISGKTDKPRYECRICGDQTDDESKFRGHMDGHLSESPPYCSVCDMYFMAIYPKRRLMEHNKKKHPELKV